MIGLGNQWPERFGIRRTATDIREPRIACDGSEVLAHAGRFVIEDGNVIATGDKSLGEVAADEAGAASD